MKRYIFLLPCLIFFLGCGSSEQSSEVISTSSDTKTIDTTAKATANDEEELDVEFPKLEPTNQSEINEELAATLKGILKAVDSKNLPKLLTYFDKDVLASFGGDKGIDGLKNYWSLNKNPRKSEIWQEIKNAVIIGGTFENDNNYWTPYVFTTFPEPYDAFEYAAVVGTAVRMRDKPSLKGEVIAELDYEIVKLTNAEGQERERIGDEIHYWNEVIRQNNQKGYIYGKYLRSAIDYRIGMTDESGKWLINTFVAGD